MAKRDVFIRHSQLFFIRHSPECLLFCFLVCAMKYDQDKIRKALIAIAEGSLKGWDQNE